MTNEQFLEICEERESALEKIKNMPICLRWGKFECRIEGNKVYYSRWIKKKRENIVGIESYETIEGDINNLKLVCYVNRYVYIDKDGNTFEDLEYWDKENISRAKWLYDDKWYDVILGYPIDFEEIKHKESAYVQIKTPIVSGWYTGQVCKMNDNRYYVKFYDKDGYRCLFEYDYGENWVAYNLGGLNKNEYQYQMAN